MPTALNLTGEVFTYLTVLNRAGLAPDGKITWACLCRCGTLVEVIGSHLKSGNTKSCGCYAREVASRVNTSHGRSHTRTWKIWLNMLNRCTNEKNPRYADYGGRGIKVCKKWQTFVGFFEDMGEAPLGHTLERKNNNRGYSKGNCLWSTYADQNRNKRNNRWAYLNGVKMTFTDIENALGVYQGFIRMNLARGVGRALSKYPALTFTKPRGYDA